MNSELPQTKAPNLFSRLVRAVVGLDDNNQQALKAEAERARLDVRHAESIKALDRQREILYENYRFLERKQASGLQPEQVAAAEEKVRSVKERIPERPNGEKTPPKPRAACSGSLRHQLAARPAAVSQKPGLNAATTAAPKARFGL